MSAIKATDGEAEVVQREALSADVARLTLRVLSPAGFRFKHGQFVNVNIPQGDAKPLIRAYSLTSPPETPEQLQLCFDTEQPGPGVAYLLALQPGERLRFKGPLGLLTLREPSTREVLVVCHISAVGVGLQLVRGLLSQAPTRRVTFIYEPKQEDAVLFAAELHRLMQLHPHFQAVVTFPEGSPAWLGPRLSLQDETLRRVRVPAETDVYAVGLGSMVASLKQALKDLGVPNEQLVTEKWSKAEE